MKTLIATTLVALSLLSTAVTANAYPLDPASSYPAWAQFAFDRPGHN